jgi:DNA invertase Pin-like site-specific DNA recombinase
MLDEYNIKGTESTLTPGLKIFKKAEVKKQGRHKNIKVAAYCRVSTDLESQKSSLDIQMESYKKIIAEHPGWVLAGIYADKGISGTSILNRVEFQKMIQDAEQGKIDYILAKSTSRFARNTMDTLYYTRHLKEKGVGVYFEEQKIDTKNATSEILLTIHAAFAQEESHSISENVKIGVRKRFAMGIPKWSTTYGYRRIEGDSWGIDKKEAAIVQRIFNYYLQGKSLPMIAAILEKENIPGPGLQKTKQWYAHSLATILHNEKYVGDVAMQKDFTMDFMTHKRKRNRDAAIPKYYKSNHHEAIIDRKTFEEVQVILAMCDRHRGSIQYPFYSFLKCPFCGENMIGVRLPSRLHKTAWTCGGKDNGKSSRVERTSCPPYFVSNDSLMQAVWKAFKNISLDELQELANKYTEAEEALEYRKNTEMSEVTFHFLNHLVDSISFEKTGDKVNWFKILIIWKFGMTSSAPVNYDRPSYIPVTPDTAEFRDGLYYANGHATEGQINAYKSIQRLFEFCNSISIYRCNEQANVCDTISKTLDIPIVLTVRTTKNKNAKKRGEGK